MYNCKFHNPGGYHIYNWETMIHKLFIDNKLLRHYNN